MADLNPKPSDVADKVPELRQKFLDKFKDKIEKGTFDVRDVERVKTDDAYCRCFLRTLKSKGNVDKALDVMDNALKWRKENEINDLTEASFPPEVLEKNSLYYKNVDKDGFKICYLNVKESDPKQRDIVKKYIAFKFEEHHRANPEEMVVCIFDMSGAGTGNMSMDITKYVITCFTTYFPAYLAYMLMYEMPKLLDIVWKGIKILLSQEQTRKIVFVRKADMKNYLNEDQLWDHMK